MQKKLKILSIFLSLILFFTFGASTTIHAAQPKIPCPKYTPFICSSQIQKIIANTLTPLQDVLNALTTRISNLENTDVDQNKKISDLEDANASLSATVTQLNDRLTTLEKRVPIPTKRVFITSNTYSGNLGGLAGADNICQQRATAANLGGNWKAWLSDDTTSAASRLTHNLGPYNLINGTKVADDWTDLTDGSLDAPLNVSELSTTINANFVWTNSFSDGSIRQTHDSSCLNWTSSNTGGATGDSTRTDSGWSDYGATICSFNHPLYCIEQ